MKIKLITTISKSHLFCFFLTLFLMTSSSSGISQNDSLYHEYLKQNDIAVMHVNYFPLQYENSVDLIFYFDEVRHRNSDLTISIFDRHTNVQELVVSPSQDYVVCSGLQTHSEYAIEVDGLDNGQVVQYVSNLSTVSTETDTEIIHLSDKLYKAIAEWSSNEHQTQPLQEYILDIEGEHIKYELAYFLQRHYDVPYCHRPAILEHTLIDFFPTWPPTRNRKGPKDDDGSTDPYEHEHDISDPRNDCHCSFTQNTRMNINPGERLEDGGIIEKLVTSYSGNPEDTNYSLTGKGAAKRMILSMKGKHGEGKYEASTIGVGTDHTEGSPFNSRISYNFICTENGNDLPQACECPKDIWVEYSYTTRMSTTVDKGGGAWIWSAGGEAVAEDHAVLIIHNGEDVSIVDAGRARAATHCESSWNTEWWTNTAELLASTVGVAIDTNSTTLSWAELADDLVGVLSTSFYSGEGDCTDKNQVGTLLSGKKKLVMTSNNPIDIFLTSFGYEFVRGFGKWYSRASMVSDYTLSAILLGEDDAESGCCSHKVAQYLTGSFDDVILTIWGNPYVVADGSVNDHGDLTDQVSGHLRLWAPFSDLDRDFKGDYILDGAWGNIIQKSSNCSTPLNPFSDSGESGTRSVNQYGIIYPNPVKDFITINREYSSGQIYDLSGQMVKKISNSKLIDVSGLASGSYILNLVSGSRIEHYKFIKVK